MKQVLILAIILVLFLSPLKAQTWQKTGSGIKATIGQIDLEIQFFSPSIVRIIKAPEGRPFSKESLSVIKTPQQTAFSAKQQSGALHLKTENLTVSLDLQSGQISFYSGAGALLLREKAGSATFTPFNDSGNPTFQVRQAFTLDNDEAIYGLGQQQTGKMVQRNLTLHMIQGNTDDYIPFFQSVKGYGVFWDNYSPTLFSDTLSSTTFQSEVGDGMDYYFLYGANADGVIRGMRDLTGQAPMFPLWTYGYWQSKERYKSQTEVVDVVKKYRELGVPIDGIIQDWQYWGNNYLWNAMEFLTPEFNNPQRMVDEVHQLNAHMAISIWNSFGPHTKPYRDLEKIGALMDFTTWPLSGSDRWPPNFDYPSGVRVYDPYHPKARDIYWKHLNAGIFSLGMDGWWLDSSEPDHHQFKPSDLDNKTYLGSFRKVRNAFPLMTVGGLYDHQRAASTDKRVFILTRSGFAGQQRYGANTWSGDVVASWEALRNQISAGLNWSLCGIPYWNSDIGGFFLWNYPKKLEDPEYRELYVRWLEFGAFCPMMRSHGTDAPREIYQFGKKGDKAYDAIEKFIRLRYRLLPYIYSTSWQVTAHQSSMMRALVMDFPKDARVWDINDQYLFGQSLLIAPVTQPMYIKQVVQNRDTSYVEDFQTVKTKETYLPSGADWYDFWTGEKQEGGKQVSKEAPLDILPIYVKAGSILPIGPEVQFAEEEKWDHLEIRVYPGADGQFVLYEDENDNYHYEKGAFSTIAFHWNNNKKTLTIQDRGGSFPGMLQNRTFHIVLVGARHGVGEHQSARPDRIIPYTGKKTELQF
ncbi:MAG: DUF5110 domain-containing protein [Haliscomenobacter sp.]|nr:DUF5110 domain-containing protein [Haliscomenobacter sp.]